MVETMGIEPTTPCLQSRCSSQLSYVPEKGSPVFGGTVTIEAHWRLCRDLDDPSGHNRDANVSGAGVIGWGRSYTLTTSRIARKWAPAATTVSVCQISWYPKICGHGFGRCTMRTGKPIV
jgi:hypothetical protein